MFKHTDGVWVRMGDTRAKKITIDGKGGVWIVDDEDKVLKWDGTKWIEMGLPGTVSIATDTHGHIYAAAAPKLSSGYTIYHKEATEDWTIVKNQEASIISIGRNTTIFIVQDHGAIMRGSQQLCDQTEEPAKPQPKDCSKVEEQLAEFKKKLEETQTELTKTKVILKLTKIQLKNTQNKLKIETYERKQCSTLVFKRGGKLQFRGCSASEVAMKECLAEKEKQTKSWSMKLA